jgi:DNA repair ATPase RecN
MNQVTEKNWKDIIIERMDEYNHKVSEISATLNKVVSELKYSPYNLKVESKRIENAKQLTWQVTIGKEVQLFYLDDFRLGVQPSGENIDNLEERIQLALLEKFKFELK